LYKSELIGSVFYLEAPILMHSGVNYLTNADT